MTVSTSGQMVEPEVHEVVAGVDDGGERAGRQRARDAVEEAGAADAARERDHA